MAAGSALNAEKRLTYLLGAYPDPNRQKRKVILKKGGRQMDLWAKYEDYLEWFEREKDRGKIDPDEEPESYDDFVDKCFEWNR